MSTTLKLAIWDVDGTLIDSRQIIQAAMNTAFHRAGLGGIDYDRTRTIVGLEVSEAIARLAPEDYSAEALARLVGYFKEAFVARRAANGFDEPLYEGALETLHRLADEGWLLGVATGKPRRGLDMVLEHYDLTRLFDTLQTVDGGAGKPHPRMVLDAMRETGTDPHQVIMIGDTRFDMEMGRNAGVHTAGVSWGFHTVDEIGEGGAHEVHHDFVSLNDSLDDFRTRVENSAS